jgi:hypothetical protein
MNMWRNNLQSGEVRGTHAERNSPEFRHSDILSANGRFLQFQTSSQWLKPMLTITMPCVISIPDAILCSDAKLQGVCGVVSVSGC